MNAISLILILAATNGGPLHHAPLETEFESLEFCEDIGDMILATQVDYYMPEYKVVGYACLDKSTASEYLDEANGTRL